MRDTIADQKGDIAGITPADEASAVVEAKTEAALATSSGRTQLS
jgi:hypothetical protein